MKIYTKYILFLAFLFINFFFWAKDIQASSCFFGSPEYIAVCKQGICEKGFQVSYIPTGNGCDSKLEINEYPENLQKIFSLVIKRMEIKDLTDGIYQITAVGGHGGWCFSPEILQQQIGLEEFEETGLLYESQETRLLYESHLKQMKAGWNNSCIVSKTVVLSRLSEDASDSAFQLFLGKWKQKEKNEFWGWGMQISKWGGVIFIIFLAGFSIWFSKAKFFQFLLIVFFSIFCSINLLCYICLGYIEWFFAALIALVLLLFSFLRRINLLKFPKK